MPKASDPYYNRKPVPAEYTEHVGFTGLTPAQEVQNRERKYSRDGGDVRKFWNPKGVGHDGLDPYYARRRVSDAEIAGVGDTGLTKEEEYLNRERKYSVTGVDVRKFGDSAKGGFHPSDDPYYGRKSINAAQIDGIGDTGMSPAEAYAIREDKASKVEFSNDPFQIVSGSGHRGSVVAGMEGVAAQAAAAYERRRSSAVGPDHVQQARGSHGGHSGYTGANLAPIPSSTANPAVTTGDEIRPSTENPSHGVGKVEVRDTTGHATGETGHTTFYDAATRDLDSVAPHEKA